MSKRTTREASPLPAPELLRDPEGAAVLNMGETKFAQVQKEDPTFPPPVWLGPRGKRHDRDALLAWALSKRGAQQ